MFLDGVLEEEVYMEQHPRHGSKSQNRDRNQLAVLGIEIGNIGHVSHFVLGNRSMSKISKK